MTLDSLLRRRSVGFIDHEGESWSCFLVTFRGRDRRWHGYFSFRSSDGAGTEDEVRTADIFLERNEDEVHRRARGLGRPLLTGLLSSALHTYRRAGGEALALRRRFRDLIRENSLELSSDPGPTGMDDEADLKALRSIYASYRLDQVAHFIALVDPDDFQSAVDRILEGERIDFGGKDRVQYSMLVIDHIEQHLPLPPFEVWAEDYLANQEEYRLYAHTLHREGRLP